MADRGDQRPCLLIFADDSWERMPFRDDLTALQRRMELDVVLVVEKPPADWGGEVGQVDAALLQRRLPQERIERDYFVCGPNPMIDAMEGLLMARGVAPGAIHSERFTLV